MNDGQRIQGEKRRKILVAATQLIAAHGYPALRLDRLCEVAACSKSAIYAYFGNKDGLLRALVEEAAGGFTQALHVLHLPGLSTAAALQRYAERLLAQALEHNHVAIVRAAISVSGEDHDIGKAYTDVALATTRSALAEFLSAKTASGDLAVGDPAQAAAQFHGLLAGWPLVNAVLGNDAMPAETDRDAYARDAVAVFLARYGRKSV